MKKYIVRSLKYFFALCVLCIALMGLMLMTGTSALSLDDTLYVMLHTDRYLMLFAAIVALAAVYPRFGYEERRVEVCLDRDFLAEPGKIGVHPNDNTATVWLKTGDLIALISEHGNTVHSVQIE